MIKKLKKLIKDKKISKLQQCLQQIRSSLDCIILLIAGADAEKVLEYFQHEKVVLEVHETMVLDKLRKLGAL